MTNNIELSRLDLNISHLLPPPPWAKKLLQNKKSKRRRGFVVVDDSNNPILLDSTITRKVAVVKFNCDGVANRFTIEVPSTVLKKVSLNKLEVKGKIIANPKPVLFFKSIEQMKKK